MGVFMTSLKKNDLEERKLVKVDVNDKSLTLSLYRIKYSMNFHLAIDLWKLLQLTTKWIILLTL